jgi:methylmalonyl-CoA mutase
MSLFSAFDKNSYRQWVDQLQKELKGADVSRFTHRNIEELSIPTYLDAGERRNYPSPLPFREQQHEHAQGSNSWTICAEIQTDDLPASNKSALHLLECGADALRIKGIGISNQDELRLVLRNIRPEYIFTHFDCGEANPSLLFMFADELKKMEVDHEQIRGSIGFDPLGDFAFTGAMESGIEDTMHICKSLSAFAAASLPNFKTICLRGNNWHNAGASITGELAYLLAAGVEYLSMPGITDKTAAQICVRMAIGADFFAGIAKIRSIRLLWARMLSGFGLDPSAYPLRISAETTSRNRTIFDPWNNQLRATTEAMAAVIAGADELTVHPYNAVFAKPDEHAQRIALNVHHILRYESHLEAVADAAAGADYIEKLTEQITAAAWDQFLSLENAGGFLAALKKGIIQDQIASNRKTLEQDFRTGKRALIGINKFANAAEAGNEPLLHQRDPLSKLPLIKPVEPFREAALIEQIRLKLSGMNPPPAAFLALTGKHQRAFDRASFSADFMAMAGIISLQGEPAVALIDQLHSHHAKKAMVIILCGADEDYPEAVATIRKDTWPDVPVLIAGKPSGAEQLLADGISGFIYLGCDALPVLYQLTGNA